MTGVTDAIGEAFAAFLGHPVVVLALQLLAVYLVVLWIASAWWTWRDAQARTTDVLLPYGAAAAVVIATPLLFPLAVVAYRVLRPSMTVAEERAARLQRALLEDDASRRSCRRCDAVVEDEWLSCPSCGASLAGRCVACGRPIGFEWQICAWCASEVPWAPPPSRGVEPSLPGPVAIPIRPGGRPLVPVMAAPEPGGPGSEPEPATQQDFVPR